MSAMDTPEPKLAVLVCGPSEVAVRRFLARYVKPHLYLQKNQWRARYREHYPLAVLSGVLRHGQGPEDLYGPHAGAAVLVLACLAGNVRGSGLAAAQAWLKGRGFAPVALLELGAVGAQSEAIELGAELVNFINLHCPWLPDEVEDLDAYLAKNSKPFWA